MRIGAGLSQVLGTYVIHDMAGWRARVGGVAASAEKLRQMLYYAVRGQCAMQWCVAMHSKRMQNTFQIRNGALGCTQAW